MLRVSNVMTRLFTLTRVLTRKNVASCTTKARVMKEEMTPTRASLIPTQARSFARKASVTRSATKYSTAHWAIYAVRERLYSGD